LRAVRASKRARDRRSTARRRRRETLTPVRLFAAPSHRLPGSRVRRASAPADAAAVRNSGPRPRSILLGFPSSDHRKPRPAAELPARWSLSMVKRLLRRIGLVPLTKYQKVSSDLVVWQGRAKKFSDEMERLKTEVRTRETSLGALNKELRESRH